MQANPSIVVALLLMKSERWEAETPSDDQQMPPGNVLLDPLWRQPSQPWNLLTDAQQKKKKKT